MITVTCDNCGIECLKKQDQVDKYNYQFCSRECHYEWKRNNDAGDNHPLAKPIYIPCEICGKETRRTPHELELKTHFYCSRECQHKGNGLLKQGITIVDVKCGQCGKDIQVNLAKYNYYHKRSANPNFFCCEECRANYWSEHFSGENAGNWKGGITKLSRAIRTQSQYYKWRNQSMKRDSYKCQSCGTKDNLIVHHIEQMQTIMNKNNITTIEEARDCEELWDITNGITLCTDCHKLEHSTRGEL